MVSLENAVYIVAAVAVCTFITRVAPFILFAKGGGVPDSVDYLGKILPPAIMATLIVYCLKNVDFFAAGHGLAEILSVACVVLLHHWKRNNLLSIGGGTVCYMALVQYVFA